MKKSLLRISFLSFGVLLITACSEDKTGNSPDKIRHEIAIDQEELMNDMVSSDTLISEDSVVVIPPPLPEPPPPLPPDPWPDPDPDPGPGPHPIPDPLPIPEPPPHPRPVIGWVDFPDVQAEFPGGDEAMMEFVRDNIKYPQIAKESGDQGRVYVEFIIEKDGSLSNIKIMRGVSKALDTEARRVIKMMPNWKPAESKGNIVRSKSRLPITFRLD